MKKTRCTRLVLTAALALACPSLLASEGGGLAIYPDGLENYMSGALPPPGVHLMLYGGGASYDKLRDNDGNEIPIPGFKVDVGVLAPRVVWVTEKKILGGQLVLHAIAPLLDVKFKAGGTTFKSSGLGDITLGVGLGYHASQSLHYVLGLDLFAPTGNYDQSDPSSLGKNHWTFQPVAAVSYVQPSGLNADIKLMYDVNNQNSKTHTRSGQAIHADYAAGWGFGKGWVVGIGGYMFQQVTSDSGPNSAAGKARAIGFGPSIRYFDGKGFLITAKLQKEFDVRNRPQGTQVYLKATIPF